MHCHSLPSLHRTPCLAPQAHAPQPEPGVTHRVMLMLPLSLCNRCRNAEPKHPDSLHSARVFSRAKLNKPARLNSAHAQSYVSPPATALHQWTAAHTSPTHTHTQSQGSPWLSVPAALFEYPCRMPAGEHACVRMQSICRHPHPRPTHTYMPKR
jgi:hypothetical protein